MSKDIVLQHIILPTQADLEDNWGLFYHGTRGVLAEDELHLPKYAYTDFYSYLNGFSNCKWKKYTNVGAITLYLDVTGTCDIEYAAYSEPLNTPLKKVFNKQIKTDPARATVSFTFPDSDEQILGFEIRCTSDCTIHGGYYATEAEESECNHVELSLATTTCYKEAFIKRNVKAVYEELLRKEDWEISQHLQIHIVDNGRSLERTDFPADDRIYLHPNKNVGGSGGFARGMIESLEQTPQATNILLMDDDVLILPESIYRTYMLLKLQKEEYKSAFINGAMLYYEDKCRQHEDMGTITPKAEFIPKKPRYFLPALPDLIDNEKFFPERNNQYGAWWYSCIPTKTVKQLGLPLPLFIRVDDVEYGLRARKQVKPELITMNGICIWHMGFTAKYNASFDLYQIIRNLHIAKATSGVLQDADLLGDYKRKFRMNLMTFNYPAAELALRAMEDYLRGPSFIEQDLGEKIMKENAQKNETLQPITDLTDEFVDLGFVFGDTYRSRLKRLVYGITYNGQRFLPDFLLKEDWVAIPFNAVYTPSKIFRHKKLMAVNPDNRTAAMRTMDKKKFRELLKRSKRVMKDYKKNNARVMQEYQAASKKLTSMEFWKKYLEI